MFKVLGIIVAIYTTYAAMAGEVYARSGYKGRAISRQDEPIYFWSVVGIYAALSIALLTIF
jgi:hypothetical protein